MKPRSLVRRTVGIVLATQIICAIVLCGAALLHEREVRLRAFDVRLQGRSDSVLGAIQDANDPDDNVWIDPTELNIPEKDVYAVYNRGGRYLGGSDDAPEVLIRRGKDGFRNQRVHHSSFRVLQSEGLRVIDRAETDGVGRKRPVTIVYATAEAHMWHEIYEAARFYLFAIALAAALTVGIVAVFLRRALQPIGDLASAAGQISAPSLEFAAPASVLRLRELRPLAEVLTESVARLKESFEKEHRFVGDAAHELKTAVAVVRSSAQLLLLRPRSTGEYVHGLGQVIGDNTRVEALIGQMLQLARVEEAIQVATPMIDLGQSAAATLAQLQPIAAERGLRLRLDSAPGMLVGLAAERADVLVSNLVMNAMQHSQPGACVSVSLARCSKGEVTLQVQDSGSGISAEALPHIFERFYREDTSRSRETGGTGLGLAICKSIVDASGGVINLRSGPGCGTTVTVIFSGA